MVVFCALVVLHVASIQWFSALGWFLHRLVASGWFLHRSQAARCRGVALILPFLTNVEPNAIARDRQKINEITDIT